jgi:hypothetical protein
MDVDGTAQAAGSMLAKSDVTQRGRGLLHEGKTSFGMLKLMRRIRRVRPVLPLPSAFTGFRFPREVIVLAVRSMPLSYRPELGCSWYGTVPEIARRVECRETKRMRSASILFAVWRTVQRFLLRCRVD